MDCEAEIQDLKRRLARLEDCCKTLRNSLEKKQDKKEPPLPPVWPPPLSRSRGATIVIEEQKEQ